MFKLIKRLFTSKKAATTSVNVTDKAIRSDRTMSFDLSISFDIDTHADDTSGMDINVSSLNFVSTSENAKAYMSKHDIDIIKATISLLCTAASEHILVSNKEIVKISNNKDDVDDIIPHPDRKELN
jgi:hypothetical protein